MHGAQLFRAKRLAKLVKEARCQRRRGKAKPTGWNMWLATDSPRERAHGYSRRKQDHAQRDGSRPEILFRSCCVASTQPFRAKRLAKLVRQARRQRRVCKAKPTGGATTWSPVSRQNSSTMLAMLAHGPEQEELDGPKRRPAVREGVRSKRAHVLGMCGDADTPP
ncbi:unnamed protein product [Symbiodinium natans]|uniref:Uncharacterized protein n=1 Tax=Symbiodinium natans TaxID=878477 RepID=A0A812S060_9DINO|nr:unnamed protein product [Symbiodinium natans]